VNLGKTTFLPMKTPARVVALVLFILMACTAVFSSTVLPLSISDPKPAIPHKSELKGIPRFGEVTPMLFRGGRPSKEGLEALSQLGVDLVIDLRGTNQKERRQVHALGMRYMAIPWHCPFPHDKTFARFLKIMRENRNKKVFVHCRLGDDRTGMMIAAYRMSEQGWTANRAATEMRAYGFSPVHHLICPGLAGYEKNFPKRLKTDPVFRTPPPAPDKK
jgi:tyrosine-protein phosphatase SIW14